MRIIFFLLSTLIFTSCANKKDQPLLTSANLTSWFISVDENTDTVLSTPKGALIKIEKGTFTGKVKLEIKEAYSMQDILLAGLVTESNGRPLNSGGMIYINAADQRNVALQKPITIALPTAFVDSQMQVYKSEPDSINWVEPDTLPENKITQTIEDGRLLFQSNCATCHSLDRSLTGPALRGFLQRGNWRNREKLYNWIRNPALYMATDAYAQNLKNQYGSVMQGFPALTNESINAIVSYLENAEEDPYDDITWVEAADSNHSQAAAICRDTIYFSEKDTTSTIQALNPELLSNTGESVTQTTNASLESVLRQGFTDAASSRAYIFKIETLGWYNVDADVEGMAGTLLCDLEIEVLPKEHNGMNVYVFLPRHKNLSVGTQGEDNVFHFNKLNGKIPLFLGENAIAIAFGSIGDELYVGTTEFTVKEEQRIKINLQKSSEEKFLDQIRQNKLEGINLGIEKQKMKVEIGPCDNFGADTSKYVTFLN